MGVNDMLRVPAKALTNYKLLYPVVATQQVSRQEGIRIQTLEGESLFGILIVNHLHEPTVVTNKSSWYIKLSSPH